MVIKFKLFMICQSLAINLQHDASQVELLIVGFTNWLDLPKMQSLVIKSSPMVSAHTSMEV